jgi:outer membrane scaffolding protein for murein synthesis (MipA/OmpV family)
MTTPLLNTLHLKGSRARWATATLLVLATSSQAQEGPPLDAPMTGSSEVLLGVGVAHQARYLGSNLQHTRALPVLSARWSNGWFAGTRGMGYQFRPSDTLSWGVRATFDLGRDASDADALKGMDDVPSRVELGGFVSYRFLPALTLTSSLRAGSGKDRDGVLADLGLRSAIPITPSWRLMGSLTATAANRSAMQSLFGVSPQEASRAGYKAYAPEGGLRDIRFQVGLMTSINPRTMVSLGLNSTSLLGNASDSPLTRQKTSTGAFAMLMFKL